MTFAYLKHHLNYTFLHHRYRPSLRRNAVLCNQALQNCAIIIRNLRAIAMTIEASIAG